MRAITDAALLTNFQDFMTELMLSRQVVFASEHALSAELSGIVRDSNGMISVDEINGRFTRGMDTQRETFHGKKLTIPLQLNDVPGAAAQAEGATFPAAAPFDTAQATLNLARIVQPIALTLDLVRDAQNGSTSAMESTASYVESAYSNLARTEEDFWHGNSDALLCNVASNTGTGSLVVDVGTSAPWDQLTPGRVVSVLTRSNGADPGNGKRRKIASVSRSGGTVTFKTAAVASDGGSGNITFSSSEGIYIDSSYGNAPQGIGSACATSGQFQGIDKGSVAQWQGVRVNGASAALSDPILNNLIYHLRGNGVSAPDFAIGHPLTVDLYVQSKQSQTRLDMQEATLKSGFSGVIFQGADRPFPILKSLNAPRGTIRTIVKDVVKLYGDEVGPSFIDDDGSMWRFFSRAAIKEADLFDRVQLGVKDCGKLGEIYSLAETSLT